MSTKRWRFRPLIVFVGIVNLSMSLVSVPARRLLSGLDAPGVRNRRRRVGVLAAALPLSRTQGFEDQNLSPLRQKNSHSSTARPVRLGADNPL